MYMPTQYLKEKPGRNSHWEILGSGQDYLQFKVMYMPTQYLKEKPGRISHWEILGSGQDYLQFKVMYMPAQYSSGSSSSSSKRKTGPSLQMYLLATLQRPHLPMPHFMRISSVV